MIRHELGKGAYTLYDEHWLGSDQADDLMSCLLREMEWSQRPIFVFGKPLMQPRLIAWAGETPYKYSGQTLPSAPVPDVLGTLMARLSELCETPFNHVLLNRYRDGRDSMGYHADNEPELGKNPTIAAISLGVSRKFALAPKGKKTTRARKTFSLSHGSLLVMGGTIQHRWRHAVPKMAAVQEERINLTFRFLRGPPGWRGDGQRKRSVAKPSES